MRTSPALRLQRTCCEDTPCASFSLKKTVAGQCRDLITAHRTAPLCADTEREPPRLGANILIELHLELQRSSSRQWLPIQQRQNNHTRVCTHTHTRSKTHVIRKIQKGDENNFTPSHKYAHKGARIQV